MDVCNETIAKKALTSGSFSGLRPGLHAHADGGISSHMVSHQSARIPRRYRAEAGIDISDKFLHHKVFPVSGYRRVHKPRSPIVHPEPGKQRSIDNLPIVYLW